MKLRIAIEPFEIEVGDDVDLTIPLGTGEAEKLAELVYDRILGGIDYRWEPVRDNG